MIHIGIDPGTRTGLAAWDDREKRFLEISTLMIHEAMERVKAYLPAPEGCRIYVEDARLRKWYGKKGRESLQGAGSIKRDSAIWDDYLKALGADYRMLPPQVGGTKIWDLPFKNLTGWTGKRTSEHARDAAMIVYGR